MTVESGQRIPIERNILLVDDSEDDCMLMQVALTRAAFPGAVRELRSGEEAMACLAGEGPYSDRAQHPMPSLMFLDLNMPRKSGFEVLAWARARPGLKRLPICVLTASVRQEDIARALELGATSYLVKPTNLDTLASNLRCLREWMRVDQFWA